MSIDIKINRPIVLIGMMGCGKSHIGRILSECLEVSFFDTDSAIEQDQSMSISDIFSQHGEGFFRTLETSKLKNMMSNGASVISTGGGIVTTPENLALIKAKSISIWLKSDVDTIIERLSGDSSRPLLQNDNPQKTLQHLLNSREALYSKADIFIDNEGDVGSVIEKIKQELGKYNEAI